MASPPCTTHMHLCVHVHMHILIHKCIHINTHINVTQHIYTQHKQIKHAHIHTHTGLAADADVKNGTYEVSNNMFQENVAYSAGAAVAMPLRAGFTISRTQTVTVFEYK